MERRFSHTFITINLSLLSIGFALVSNNNNNIKTKEIKVDLPNLPASNMSIKCMGYYVPGRYRELAKIII